MTFSVTPYSIIMTVALVITLWITIAVWIRRYVRGGLTLALFMSAGCIWVFGAVMELSAVGLPAKVFWSKVEYLGTLSAPVLFLIFVLKFTHQQWPIKKKYYAFLFVVPAITLTLAFTNEQHGLIWSDFTASPLGNNLLIYGHGPAWWLGVIGYSYAVFLVAAIFLVRAAMRMPAIYRSQAAAIILSALFPWVGNLIYVLGISPVPGLELTPLFAVFTGGLLGWAVYRLNLLDPLPLARNTLVETMSDGVIVLDVQNRVMYVNHSVAEIFRSKSRLQIGQHAGDVFAAWPHLVQQFADVRKVRTEIVLEGTGAVFLEVTISPLMDRGGAFIGRMIILHDITRRKLFEAELKATNEQLRARLLDIQVLQAALEEQVVRDGLTGLFNRRYMDETLKRELARSRRNGAQVAVVMFDIDHFKDYNDRCGHQAGDEKLQALGELFNAQIRASDIACRYGGEEFVVIMPGANLADACKRADELRAAFAQLTGPSCDTLFSATLSGGAAVFPQHGTSVEDMIRAADRALYAAKAAGRNCVVAYMEQDG